jgi:competence protein ComEC
VGTAAPGCPGSNVELRSTERPGAAVPTRTRAATSVNLQANSSPVSRQPSGRRQPLLWAALAFAAGIVAGVYAWRPSLWWVVAFVVIAASGAHLSRRRWRSAFVMGMASLFVLGALAIQVSAPDGAGDSQLLQFADGSEVVVTAHVIKEGTLQEEGSGTVRQRLDLETEQIASGNERLDVQAGMRLSIYDQQGRLSDGDAARLFGYGERLRFSAKLSAPRNFRNPGAFDYRTYLRSNGIAALASAKSASVELLPGFSGSRVELWRSRIHRSIIEKIHALWPPRQAALMDAMVIGEDAFINRPTRTEFQ